MISHTKVALCLLVATALCVGRTSVAQEGSSAGNAAGEVGVKLEELKNSPSYERAEKRDEILSLGMDAVQPLIAEVARFATEKDKNYVVNCILLLGQLKDASATDVLLEAIKSTDKQISYWACKALGNIWEGKDGQSDRARAVNGALLGVYYGGVSELEAFGPGLAIAKINNIQMDPQEMATAQSLRAAIDAWVTGNPQSLPELKDQPWPLLLKSFIGAREPAVRQEARDVLVTKKPLGAVDVILSELRKPKGEVPEDQWKRLGSLLGQISALPFPAEASGTASSTRQQQVEIWRDRWFAELKKRTAEEYRQYSWRNLERYIRAMQMEPTEATSREIDNYRGVLIWQMTGPDDIPDEATESAVKLLEEPLAVKKSLRESLDAAKKATEAFEKVGEFSEIQDLVAEAPGREVGQQFLMEFTRLARTETNRDVLTLLANILTRLSDVPCDLSQPSDEQRNRAIDQWQRILKETHPLLIPG